MMLKCCFWVGLSWWVVASGVAGEPGEVVLVQDGEPRGVVVVAAEAPPLYHRLAAYFVDTVERSTGARLPVVTEEEEAALPGTTPRLHLGPAEAARKAGVRGDELPEENCRILTDGHAVFIWGNDALDGASPQEATRWRRTVEAEPTRWGINRLLEEQLGVRWLWPGPLGTYVPRHPGLRIPPTDLSFQPKLEVRRFGLGVPGQRLEFGDDAGLKQTFVEASEWLANHQGNYRGERARISVNHAFNDWWTRFGKKHPEWFVPPLPGQPFSAKSQHRKLRFTNPEVIEQIAREYEQAGAPKYWTVSENDGGGFDVSDEARALDLPANQPIEDIWNTRGNLTARYVTFWNRIHERLRRINPEVTLVALAYSCYNTPPPPERPVTANMVIGMVCSYRSQENWQKWREAINGGSMVLRPNWGWIGGNAPHLPLDQLHSFLQFASENGMVGFHMDSILGYWGTQAPNYYLMARTVARPELDKETILDEFTSAFGAASGKIREYLDHWQALADRYGYTVSRDVVPDGEFNQLFAAGKIDENWFRGPREAMVYLYNDEALAPGWRLLDEADALLGEKDSEARQRVQFLRDGLAEMKATRDLMALGQKVRDDPTADNVKQLAQGARELDALRKKISPSHAIWGENVTMLENRRLLPIRPENMKLPEIYDGEDI
jgi:hypothetical protein